jgi:hypothetical protein
MGKSLLSSLISMKSRPASKGWFQQFGSKHTRRRERHIKSQMKFFSGPKFMTSFQNKAWKVASKKKSYEK